jgi:hypothetical protein
MIRVMERHLRKSRKLAGFIGIVALSLLLGACGGGGGGGGASGMAQVAGMTGLDTHGTATTDVIAPAPSRTVQITGLTGRERAAAPANATNALAQQAGFASLSWQAPSKRVDGQSLSMSEIAGYRIYYGTSSGDYDSVLPVDDPYTFTIQIDALPAGNYYFVMTAVDTNGNESGYSDEAVKIVQS